MPRNAAAEAKIILAVRDFWADVAAGREPELDPTRDADVVRAMAPHSVEGEICDFSGNNEIPVKLAHRAQLIEVIKSAEEECKAIETELKFLMGKAEAATGLPGWKVTFKTGMRQGYTVETKPMRILRISDQRARAMNRKAG